MTAAEKAKLNETLRSALNEASKAVAAHADLTDSTVRKALDEFATPDVLETIAGADCAKTGGDVTDCRLDRLESFEKGLTAALGGKLTPSQSLRLTNSLHELLKVPPQGDDLDAGLTGPIDAATAVAEAAQRKAHRLDLVTQSLQKLVAALGADLTAIPVADVSTTQKGAAKTAVLDIRSWLAKIIDTLDPNDRVIRVTGAWYGDFRAIGAGLRYSGLSIYAANNRYCSATAAVRAHCDGKPKCYEPSDDTAKSDGDTTKLDGPDLCGYEPKDTQYAQDGTTALVVQYQCLSPDDKLLAQAAQSTDFGSRSRQPRCQPGRGPSGGGCVNYAVLRNKADGIVACQIAIAATAAPSAPAAGKTNADGKSASVDKADSATPSTQEKATVTLQATITPTPKASDAPTADEGKKP